MYVFMLFLMLLCMTAGADAQLRTWTLADGRTLEAELTSRVCFDDGVKLVDADGEEISILLDQLSPEDQEYIDIVRVPELDLDLLRKLPQVLFSKKGSGSLRDPEIRARFGVRVKQKGSGTYNHELKAEYFAIGRQIYADRYMVLARESITFRLSKENDKRFEYVSDRWVPLRDFYMRKFAHRGEKYHGYLILVTDEFGNLVAHEESPDWLFDYSENMLKLRPGNYFDDQCVRRSPIRPEPLRNLSF